MTWINILQFLKKAIYLEANYEDMFLWNYCFSIPLQFFKCGFSLRKVDLEDY